MHIPIACYVSKIPYYCCCGNSDSVLFVGLLVTVVSLFYKLTVNCCQLCKLSLFDCAILLSYQWLTVYKKVVRLAASEGKFVLSVCWCLWAYGFEHLYVQRRVKILWNSGYAFKLIHSTFAWYETKWYARFAGICHTTEYGLHVYRSFERIHLTSKTFRTELHVTCFFLSCVYCSFEKLSLFCHKCVPEGPAPLATERRINGT